MKDSWSRPSKIGIKALIEPHVGCFLHLKSSDKNNALLSAQTLQVIIANQFHYDPQVHYFQTQRRIAARIAPLSLFQLHLWAVSRRHRAVSTGGYEPPWSVSHAAIDQLLVTVMDRLALEMSLNHEFVHCRWFVDCHHTPATGLME